MSMGSPSPGVPGPNIPGTGGSANFNYWVPIEDTSNPLYGVYDPQGMYPRCLEHVVGAKSILEYPDGLLVARCTTCGDRIVLQFNEHSILLRRAHEIAIAAVEATETEAVNYAESYHRLKERIETAKEALDESKILLDRIGDMLSRKIQGSLDEC